VEGGSCPDTRNEGKLQKREAQHEALEGALMGYGYSITTLPVIIEQSGSHCLTTS